jgi:hypothetical protein
MCRGLHVRPRTDSETGCGVPQIVRSDGGELAVYGPTPGDGRTEHPRSPVGVTKSHYTEAAARTHIDGLLSMRMAGVSMDSVYTGRMYAGYLP